jgi:threonyl-tRNA synthetase
MGILIEHYAGAFPTWLSPIQAIIIPVSEKFNDYAKSVEAQFIASGIRTGIDNSDESLGKRIRNAEKQKIPYILVVGEKEMEAETVTIRERNNPEQVVMKVQDFAKKIETEIRDKK